MQRREFVVATGGLMVAGLGQAAVPQARPIAAPARAQLVPAALPRSVFLFDSNHYAGLLQQTFNVYESKRGVAMQLTALENLPSAPGQQQFTLTFSAPGVTLRSGTYDVEHASTGITPLYLEAAAPGTWLAHFNLLS
jgi:hypothetical protein